MKPLKKNDRLIDVETNSEWMFQCKTRGPDITIDSKPKATWTYVFHNSSGHRRFIPENKMAETFALDEA